MLWYALPRHYCKHTQSHECFVSFTRFWNMLDIYILSPNGRFAGKVSRMGAEKCLEGMKNGTFLVRESNRQQGYTHAIAIR